ncbi:rho-related BTB domain-containing protein 2 isoform X2 [Ctenocephalides felis]|uniref:rho-related BTB domain-containing protein 2 isoform X2 n=1 Tax=Ctenocephalides felis TaxID=7515 RepID=UPI000E6E3E0C|nr:rho-related BTB domain-containing protein 2 isoform X2 [Ctenocephalides felis]
MDNEQPHQELVKCVVVGDTAVGKTRLICARACNKHVSLSQLLSTHVPTVWAIDQYRIYKDVLERSWEIVDSVNVSLRLWDTFGDHEKDRRFAYGRSDVVLLCFSITNPVSLRNCRSMWYQEIRKFCPQTPILLVGCKNDLRYMYRDETYLSYFRDRSPFVRATRKSDLVMPDEARAVARDLGVSYYETSVFTYFGVNEVFENAIRAALYARKQQRFWITNLKRVQRPILQAPFCPPKPQPPEVTVAASAYTEHMSSMLSSQQHTDMVLVTGSVGFPVHRFVLAASSNAFHRLLTMEFSDIGARSSSESSMVEESASVSSNQTVVTLSKLITPQAMQQCLRFIYTGSIDQRCLELQELRQAAEFLELTQLLVVLSNTQTGQQFTKSNEEAVEHYSLSMRRRLEELCIEQGLFSDISFALDDGTYPGHKPMLISRCDMMRAMLTGQFRESQAKVIVFPGVRQYTFHKLLCYLYTDEVPAISAARCLNILELANRLCLPRFLNLIEFRVIEDLSRLSQNEGNESIEHCLRLLEPVKLHNAHQLAEWCMNHLCVNYNKLCRASPRSVRLLHPDNQEYLREHRWPPVWYLKDYDYYQRCTNENSKENKLRDSNSDSGCLCFKSVFSCLGKSRSSSKEPAETNIDVSTNLFQSNANSVNQLEDITL